MSQSRIACHIPPDRSGVFSNQSLEPEGERIRAELEDFLRRNNIVSISLDTDEHCVSIDIAKLPPRIKPVLRRWGSIFVKDEKQVIEPVLEPKTKRVFLEQD
jgi:hypothetical protein